jgi:peptidylprolyl isomerase
MKKQTIALLLASALPLAAQTTAHHPATTAHTATAVSSCIKLPEISAKIPALPPGPCAKALYTLTQTPTIKLDYASPMLSPAILESLKTTPSTFSLGYIDTLVGTGPLAQPGKWYTVHYTGYLAKEGSKFDSSLDRGEPISFPYGQHRVIQGWDTGFEGMHIGGKRRLFIPYQLAYGEAGKPPVIPAKATLVFDVELIAQSDEQPKPPAPTPAPAAAKPVPAAAPPAAAAPAASAAPKPATPPAATTPKQ